MGFLSSLFDPVGAIVNGGNNSTFDSIFNPAQDSLGNSGIIPDFVSNNSQDFSNSVGNFADNVGDVNKDELKNLWGHFTTSPQQLLTGVDPLATKMWNGATGQNNLPWVGQYGGETNQDYQNSANRGINTTDGQIVGGIANAVAGFYGGQALGSLAGNAGMASGADTLTNAGMVGDDASNAGMVGSALDNASMAYQPQSNESMSQYGEPNTALGNTASGAARGGANALNDNQNPWKGAAMGGSQAGVGSNLDWSGGIGIEDPLAKAGLNGAINGGVRTAMSDPSQSGYGALVGALGGAVQQAGPTLSNWAGQAGNAVSGMFGNSGSDQDSSGGSNFNFGGGNVNPSTGVNNWGNIAAGLGSMYMASRNNAGIQSQINNLSGMYGPNSAYAQQMQQQLQRQDAASGRGSQYGTRAVELQAALANANSRNAPVLSSLYQQQRANRMSQLGSMFGMARNAGLFGNQQPGGAGFSVGGMGTPGDGGMGSFMPQMQAPNYSPITAGQGDMSQYDPSQVNQNVMGTLPGYVPGG